MSRVRIPVHLEVESRIRIRIRIKVKSRIRIAQHYAYTYVKTPYHNTPCHFCTSEFTFIKVFQQKHDKPVEKKTHCLTGTEGDRLGQGHLGGVLHDLERRLAHAQLELDSQRGALVVAVRATPLLLLLGLVAQPNKKRNKQNFHKLL